MTGVSVVAVTSGKTREPAISAMLAAESGDVDGSVLRGRPCDVAWQLVAGECGQRNVVVADQ